MSDLLDIIDKIKKDPSVIKKIDIDELLKKQNMDIHYENQFFKKLFCFSIYKSFYLFYFFY